MLSALDEVPRTAIVIALLVGPTLIWILYSRFVSPRSKIQRLDESEPAMFWICTQCRSANAVRDRRCYLCGLDREAGQGKLRVVDHEAVVELEPGPEVGPAPPPTRSPVPLMAPTGANVSAATISARLANTVVAAGAAPRATPSSNWRAAAGPTNGHTPDPAANGHYWSCDCYICQGAPEPAAIAAAPDSTPVATTTVTLPESAARYWPSEDGTAASTRPPMPEVTKPRRAVAASATPEPSTSETSPSASPPESDSIASAPMPTPAKGTTRSKGSRGATSTGTKRPRKARATRRDGAG